MKQFSKRMNSYNFYQRKLCFLFNLLPALSYLQISRISFLTTLCIIEVCIVRSNIILVKKYIQYKIYYVYIYIIMCRMWRILIGSILQNDQNDEKYSCAKIKKNAFLCNIKKDYSRIWRFSCNERSSDLTKNKVYHVKKFNRLQAFSTFGYDFSLTENVLEMMMKEIS